MQDPIYMQQQAQPIFYQQQMQQPQLQMQQQMQQQQVVVKSLEWSKKGSYDEISRDEDIGSQALTLFKEIRKDLDNLLRLNKALVMATFIDIEYENKEAEYKQILIDINKLSREEATDALVNELRIISHRLDMDISNIDAIFPQIIYSSVYMRNLMKITVEQIGYKEIKEEAQTAYSSLESIEPQLQLNKLGEAGVDGTPIEMAIRTITLLNEMRKFKAEILKLRDLDTRKRRDTRKYVLIGMFITLLSILFLIIGLHEYEIEWDDIRKYPVLGIPLGVGIWSFIGSFAAMLQQFYQKSIYEFGDTFKWVLIRPVLGVVMGSAIYLAFVNGFGITDATGNGTFIYLVAFFVGLSDTFAVGIIEKLQGAISNTFSKQEPQQPQVIQQVVPYIVTPQTQQQKPVNNNNSNNNNNNNNNNNSNNNNSTNTNKITEVVENAVSNFENTGDPGVLIDNPTTNNNFNNNPDPNLGEDEKEPM